MAHAIYLDLNWSCTRIMRRWGSHRSISALYKDIILVIISFFLNMSGQGGLKPPLKTSICNHLPSRAITNCPAHLICCSNVYLPMAAEAEQSRQAERVADIFGSPRLYHHIVD